MEFAVQGKIDRVKQQAKTSTDNQWTLNLTCAVTNNSIRDTYCSYNKKCSERIRQSK